MDVKFRLFDRSVTQPMKTFLYHDYKCSQLGFKAVAWTPTVNFHDRQKAANLFLLSQYCLFERFIGHNPPDWNVKVMDDAYLIHVRSSGYRGDV